MNHLAQCPSCPTIYYVDVVQIARGLSRFACPVCGNLADFADQQQVDPSTPQVTKEVWAIIGAVSVVAGLLIFARLADHVFDHLAG